MNLDAPRNPRNLLVLAVFAAASFVAVVAAVPSNEPLVVEGEALLGWSQRSDGALEGQDMRRFGAGWSGREQLLWRPERERGYLRLDPTVSRPGRYRVDVVLTAAPEYGIFDVSFGGLPGVPFNGYRATPGRIRVSLGVHDLEAGPHELVLVVAGRDAAASYRFAGIDRIELWGE